MDARKEELGIVESRRYEVLEQVKIECIICGKPFMFTGGEHKWCQKRALTQPKRCPDCIEQEHMEGLETGSLALRRQGKSVLSIQFN